MPKLTPTNGKTFNQETYCFTDGEKKECDLVEGFGLYSQCVRLLQGFPSRGT